MTLERIEDVVSSMRARATTGLVASTALIAGILGTSGCMETRPDGPTAAEIEKQSRDLYFSCKARLLENLNDSVGRSQCEQAYALRPTSTADYNPKLLLDQLAVDPSIYINPSTAKYERYTVQPNETLEQVAGIELRNRMLFIALARANCISNPSDPRLQGRVLNMHGRSTCRPDSTTLADRPVLSANEHFQLCKRQLLQDINSAEAREHCLQAVNLGSHRSARRLIDQLDRDPRAVLPEPAFDYTVQSGDSLTQLAKEYFKNELFFVALARYNNISNPSRLAIGQTIQIAAPQRQASNKPPPERDERDVPDIVEPADQEEPVDATALAKGMAYEAFSRGDHNDVIAILTGTPDLELDDEMVQMLESSRMKIRIQELMAEADYHNSSGDIGAAVEKLQQVVVLEPSNSNAASKLAQLSPVLIKSLEREAAASFNTQRYEAAEAFCKRLLDLDAANSTAEYYMSKIAVINQRSGQ